MGIPGRFTVLIPPVMQNVFFSTLFFSGVTFGTFCIFLLLDSEVVFRIQAVLKIQIRLGWK